MVLNGHWHQFEYYSPQNPAGHLDQNGIQEFVVGTGGASPFAFVKPYRPHSHGHLTPVLGVLQLTLKTTSYSWEFKTVPHTGPLTSTIRFSGSRSCPK